MSGNVVRTFDDVQSRFNDAGAQTLTAAVTAVALINPDADFVTITSSASTKIVVLPAAVNNKTIKLYVVANGCEVRSAVAADKLNNVVVGATNEGLLIAAALYTATYNATTGNWTMDGKDAEGVAVAACVPDAV